MIDIDKPVPGFFLIGLLIAALGSSIWLAIANQRHLRQHRTAPCSSFENDAIGQVPARCAKEFK